MSTCSSPLFTPPSSPLIKSEIIALRSRPGDIKGLYYFPAFFDNVRCEEIVQDIIDEGYFNIECGSDQAVLFGNRLQNLQNGLPRWCENLLDATLDRLQTDQTIPKDILNLLFPAATHPSDLSNHSYTRQLILNCYEPGQGIANHIDLPHKFLDGIMIFSFGSGITMDFSSADPEFEAEHAIYLVPGSLCILSGDSRWIWKHGIASRMGDWVWSDDEVIGKDYIARGRRLSITVRWYNIDSDNEGCNNEIRRDDE